MCCGCHDTGHSLSGLNNRSVSSHSSGGWKSQITVRRGQRLVWTLHVASRRRPPHCVLLWWGEPCSPFPLCQDLGFTGLCSTLRTGFKGAPLHRPHLQTLSHWGVGTPTYETGGQEQSIYNRGERRWRAWSGRGAGGGSVLVPSAVKLTAPKRSGLK